MIDTDLLSPPKTFAKSSSKFTMALSKFMKLVGKVCGLFRNITSVSEYSNGIIAEQTWEMLNNVRILTTIEKDIDKYEQKHIKVAKPCMINMNNRIIKVSTKARMKIIKHLIQSTVSVKIIGLLFGKFKTNTMIVTDSFALYVKETNYKNDPETQFYDSEIDYNAVTKIAKAHQENIVGWYHCHINYKGLLADVDKDCQNIFGGIIIGPITNITGDKVVLGSFQTPSQEYGLEDVIKFANCHSTVKLQI